MAHIGCRFYYISDILCQILRDGTHRDIIDDQIARTSWGIRTIRQIVIKGKTIK